MSENLEEIARRGKDALEHHGVKGMRWGTGKKRPESFNQTYNRKGVDLWASEIG